MKANKSMKVLAAVDGSDHALAGIALLRDLPLPPGSQVTVMAVFTPRDASFYTEYEHYVEQAQVILKDQPWQVRTEVLAGHPADTLAQYADQQECDLIILGARGKRSALGVLLGGVAQQVVEYANRPVLVVRAPYQNLKRVIVALDGSPCSDLALRFLAQIPLPDSIKTIDFLHVLPPPPLPQALVLAQTIPMGMERASVLDMQEKEEIDVILREEELQGKELLEQAIQRFIDLMLPLESKPTLNPVLLRGDAFEEISLYTETHPTDLIVVGSRGLSGVKGWLLGSLSRKLVHGGRCSVLVVRGNPAC